MQKRCASLSARQRAEPQSGAGPQVATSAVQSRSEGLGRRGGCWPGGSSCWPQAATEIKHGGREVCFQHAAFWSQDVLPTPLLPAVHPQFGFQFFCTTKLSFKKKNVDLCARFCLSYWSIERMTNLSALFNPSRAREQPHTHIHTCAHTHAHTPITHTCIYSHTDTHSCICTHTHTHAHIHAYTNSHDTDTSTHRYMCLHTDTHAHRYTHTPVLPKCQAMDQPLPLYHTISISR